MAFLEAKNIVKSFGTTQVLKDVSFSLEKGEVLAIIGSSGGGKTTLLRCLNFLELCDAGSIYLNGELLFTGGEKQTLNDVEIRKKRLHFGLVFQSFNLFPQYNVLDNVTLALDLLSGAELSEQYDAAKREAARLPCAKRRAAKKRCKSEFEDKKRNSKLINVIKALRLLRTVGLLEKAKSYPYQLSGGQCQRVAIARALALSPDVLCFDEPTSALDPELTGEVLKVIRGLKSKDRTMVIVTHEMNFARDVADKVIFISEGIIAEQGTPDEVFNHPKNPKTKAFFSRTASNETGEDDEKDV